MVSYFRIAIRRAIVWVLTAEAKAILKKYHPKIIIVTGSVGKTSAKDAVYTALSSGFFVRKSEKSFNSDIGVPLTVIGAPNGWMNPIRWLRNIIDGASLLISHLPYPKYLVVEVGADRPGDITKSLTWLVPDVVVATRFPDVPVHVEFYQSPEAVFAEEIAPLSWLSENGNAVVNADDPRAAGAPAAGSRISFGFSKDATVRASRFHISSKNKMPSGISFDVSFGAELVHVSVPGILGKTHAYAVLAGIAAAVAEGIPLTKAADTFAKHVTPSGRMKIIEGLNDTILIDDSYNASPVATEEALETLSDVPRRGRRIAVLGDMLELGGFSVAEHHRIGALVARSADILITVGVRARGIAEAARGNGMSEESVHECENSIGAASFLAPVLSEGDVVLIKGSQSIRMEHAVRALMAKPSRASELLVRQDAEWRKR